MQYRCPNCMLPIKQDESACPHCGHLQPVVNGDGALACGTLLRERFYIGRVIRSDAVSVVYVGYDMTAKQKVMLRECSGAFFDTVGGAPVYTAEQLVERFVSYARSMAGIGLCSLFPKTMDVFLEDGKGYWVQEFVEGENLKALLSGGIRVSGGNVLKITDALCRGLKIAHASHRLFGAVMPDTIYIDKNGGIKLYGIGAPYFEGIGDLAFKTTVLNPSYCAPEVFEPDAKCGPYTDVYGVAAIAYRLFTNTIPPVSFLRQSGESVVSPKRKNASVHRSTSTALLNAMNWQPSKRTATVERLLHELGAKKVTRRLSAQIVVANLLGVVNRLVDSIKAFLFKSSGEEPKKGRRPYRMSRRTAYITLGSICGVLVAVLGISLAIKWTSGGDTAAVSSKDGWYYGNGTDKDTSSVSSYLYISSNSNRVVSGTASGADNSAVNGTICPDVVGMYFESAVYTIESDGLRVGQVTHESSTDYAEGYIIWQSVQGGLRVEQGKSISLKVSSGAAKQNKLEIPAVEGKEMQEAVALLEQTGFTNIKHAFEESNTTAGVVLKQSLSAGTAAEPDAQITLTVSGKGVTVPDFQGLTIASMLRKNVGLKIELVDENGVSVQVNEIAYNSYRVTAQSLATGIETYQGAPIRLTISHK